MESSETIKGGNEIMLVEILIAISVISAWIITFCEAFEVWD